MRAEGQASRWQQHVGPAQSRGRHGLARGLMQSGSHDEVQEGLQKGLWALPANATSACCSWALAKRTDPAHCLSVPCEIHRCVSAGNKPP